MAGTTAQVNTTGSSGGNKCNGNCDQYNILDPRRSICKLQESLCQAVGGAGNAANAASQNLATQLAQSLSQAIINLIEAPFKALGLGGLRDALWRGLLIFIALIVLAFGLLIFAGSAVKEEASKPEVEEAAKAAAVAA